MATVADERARYRFGPLERRGLVAGWRGGQLVTVSCGLLLAVLVLRRHPSVGGVVLALGAVSLSVALATWPVAGRTAEQWAPDAVRHLHETTARRRRGSSPFAGLEVLRVDAGGDCVAVICDTRAGTYTGVVRAYGPGFVLTGAEDKTARVSAWAGALAAPARPGSAVHRLQWTARCLPDEKRQLEDHWRTAAVLDPRSAPQRSYAALMEAEARSTRAHEVLLSVTVDARRSGRVVRSAGGGRQGACTVVLREVAWLRRQLSDAAIDSSGLLDPGELAQVVRAVSDGPASEGPASERRRHACWPWPMAVQAEWGRARVDDTWHVTYWVAEWPRREVGPDFLAPLLLSGVRSSVSVVMEPLDAAEAARRAEQARTADLADAELRRRGGFLSTARRTSEEEMVVRREHELADGHAQYRFSGYVTVSAAGPDELEDGCARIEQAAGRSGLELRRCYGDQGRAFACTLPLGRGLP
ncbi:MAG TPA: SCO6880 family protein [Acidimicrobiales bacterium]|nr:SCO6880 family protein [Acidimicrobiales bacterium]